MTGRSAAAGLWMLLGLLAASPAHANMGADGRWHPGIGDPTWVGWLTVLAYAGAAACALRCAIHRSPRDFWWAVAFSLALLGLNKQLDLQSWFTQWGRDLATSGGWYAQRHEVQVRFIKGLALASALLMAVGVMRWWRWLGHIWLALSGLVLLAAFVVLRAASFHHVDQWLFSDLGGLRWNGIMELSGIALVASGAWRAFRVR